MTKPIIELVPTVIHVEGKALGRNKLVNWHQVARLVRADATSISSVAFATNLSTCLDQGSVGSCTGNAWAHVASSQPRTRQLNEANALDIYKRATVLDDAIGIAGHYPPSDTGSTGYYAAQAAVDLGYLAGSPAMAVGLTAVLQQLQAQPGATGIDWYQGFDNPDSNGLVQPTGLIRGGHEIALVECDVENRIVWFGNSWGKGYGVTRGNRDGCFGMTFDDYELMLASGGDCCFVV